MTLVELLISLLLGLLLSGGMAAAYLAAKRNAYYEEQMARMQENGRYALRLLSRELAMVGFYGGVLSPSQEVEAVAVGGDCSEGDWALEVGTPLDVISDYNGQAPPVSLYNTIFTCLDSAAIAPGSDLLVIKRTAAEASLLRGVPAETLTASDVQSWYLRLTSGAEPEWERLPPVDLRHASRAVPSLSYWEAISRILFIRAYSNEVGDGLPSLCMETLAGDAMTTRCLVEGVENLQFEFGVDSDGDGVPNTYTPTPTQAQMRSAVSAKIYLLLRSIGPLPGYRDSRTYHLGREVQPASGDAYLRRVVSTTVMLRNYKAPRS
ncbi:MAG: PilW family protein [Halioglobus sp.]|nr:PilW family protein [Halioglobus sp.]